MKLALNKVVANKAFVSVALAVFFLIFIGVPISFLFLLSIILLVSLRVPSDFFLQKIAIASVLVIGLSPLYLLVRGLVVDFPLRKSDLYLYGLITLLLSGILFRFSFHKAFESIRINKTLLISGFSGLIFGFVLQNYLSRKSFGYGIAWISSGDSKNHLVSAAELVKLGDLDPATFLTQPVNLSSTLSLLLSQIGNDLTVNPERLGVLMQNYAYFWITLLGLMGLAFAASGQVVWGKFRNEVPIGITIALTVIPFFSLILGPALNDGFFTAIFGITTLTVVTTWLFELDQAKSPKKQHVFIGMLLFFSSLMSWMFVIAITFPILLVGFRRFLLSLVNSKIYVNVFLILFVLIGLLAVHFSSPGQSLIRRIKTALNAEGAVSVTNPNLYYSLILVTFVVGLLLHSGSNLGRTLMTLSSVHAISLVGFKQFSNLGLLEWNYYLLKYQWILTSSLVALLSAILLVYLNRSLNDSQLKSALATSLIFTALFTFSESSVTVNRALPKILSGWENPRSSIMDIALRQDLDYKNPTMFFHYGYSGDARLANFWMNSFSDPLDPIRGWNYTIDTSGTVNQICDVNAYYPHVKILTSDLKLEELLAKECPQERFYINLIPSPF